MTAYKLRYEGPRWTIGFGSYTGVERFALGELNATVQRCMPYVVETIPATDLDLEQAEHVILTGTPESNPRIADLIARELIPAPEGPQAYVIARLDSPWNPGCSVIVVAGGDPAGVLYGAVDFGARIVDPASPQVEAVPRASRDAFDAIETFTLAERPHIDSRGIWSWGYVIYDYRRFLDNMARLKMNMLTIWNDCPPLNIRGIIDYAHRRGVKIVLGFPWGWGMGDVDLGSDAGRQHIKEMVLDEYTRNYSDLDCDGIYFQTLTEHTHTQIEGVPVARIVCDMVNEIAAEVFALSPDLEIQFGLHASSIAGYQHELGDLDSRITIVWEDAGVIPYSYNPIETQSQGVVTKGPEGIDSFDKTLALSKDFCSIRSAAAFGMVAKGWCALGWGTEFEHHKGYLMGEREPGFIAERLARMQSHWDEKNAVWGRNFPLAARFYREILACEPASMIVTGLIEDGLLEACVQPSVAIFAETLWNPQRDPTEIERTAQLLGAAANARI
jgi:hypothetical protein